MKTPRYTDQHRYPNGYRRSAETNVEATFKRIRAEQSKNAKEVQAKVAPMRKAAAR